MAGGECAPVAISRRISASAHDIFQLLADPGRHPDLDGSGMLRAGAVNAVVSAVGDVFVMKMHLPELGDYEMRNHVVEFEPDRRIGWEPAPGDAVSVAESGLPIGTPQGYRWSFELAPDGQGATIVTEMFDCSRAAAEVREAVHDGRDWVDSMTKTLETLDRQCAR